MYCDNCYFKKDFKDMCAIIPYCSFYSHLELSQSSIYCDVARVKQKCPHYINCDFVHSFIKEYFFNVKEQKGVEKSV